MGKKRKSNRSGPVSEPEKRVEQTKYNIDEDFADSEDDFFAGREKILLEDGPLNKRQKVHKDGQRPQSSGPAR